MPTPGQILQVVASNGDDGWEFPNPISPGSAVVLLMIGGSVDWPGVTSDLGVDFVLDPASEPNNGNTIDGPNYCYYALNCPGGGTTVDQTASGDNSRGWAIEIAGVVAFNASALGAYAPSEDGESTLHVNVTSPSGLTVLLGFSGVADALDYETDPPGYIAGDGSPSWTEIGTTNAFPDEGPDAIGATYYLTSEVVEGDGEQELSCDLLAGSQVGAFYILALELSAGPLPGSVANPVGDVVMDLCVRAGLSPSQVDTSLLTEVLSGSPAASLVFPTNVVDGYIIERMTTAAAAIKELMAAFFFGACESDGVLRFVPRTFLTADEGSPSEVFSIVEGDLGLESDNAKLEEDFAQDQDLPVSCTVLYNDIALNWQQGKQIKQRNNRVVTTKQQKILSCPLSLEDTEARQIAEATLYSEWQARQSFTFNLWRALYLLLDPTDIIYLDYEDQFWEVRILQNTLGQGFCVAVKCVSEDVRNYSSVAVGAINQGFLPAAPVTAALTVLYLLDIPLLRDADSNPSGSGFYASLGSGMSGWPGAALYQSTDDATFTQLDSDEAPASFGNALNALPPPATPWTWDTVNTLTIRLVSGVLAGDTDLNVLNGSNCLIVGQEILQFANAVQNEDGSWTVSRLLRGRRGSEGWCAGHSIGETVIQPLAGGVLREQAALAQIDQLRYYRGVTYGQDVSAVSDVDLTLVGYDLYPYAPVQIAATIDDSGDINITWIRRTRIGGEWLDGVGSGTVPLSEASEAYQVDILDGETVVRTLSVTSPAAEYTAADQTADFGELQTQVAINVYQMSASIGRGFPGEATV